MRIPENPPRISLPELTKSKRHLSRRQTVTEDAANSPPACFVRRSAHFESMGRRDCCHLSYSSIQATT